MKQYYGKWTNSTLPPETPKQVQSNESPMPAIICDLDGTLSLNDGHGRSYDASTAHVDKPCKPVKQLLEIYYRFMGYQILYVTGREEKYRPQTEEFLRKYHCPPGQLHMRATDDFRKDHIVKQEIFDTKIRDRYNVELVIDDKPSVIQMWRRLGLFTMTVGSLEDF